MIFCSVDCLKGLHVGDELIVLNNLMVSELDMVYIETTLEECESVSLTVRSCRSVDQSCEIAKLVEIQKEYVDEMDCLTALSTQPWQRNELHGNEHYCFLRFLLIKALSNAYCVSGHNYANTQKNVCICSDTLLIK